MEHRTETEEVGPGIHRVSSQLLRRHVPRCADDKPGGCLAGARGHGFLEQVVRCRTVDPLGVVRRGDHLGDPEVEQLHMPLAGHQHVLGLEVAVDDAARVRRGQALRHLRRPVQRSGQRDGPLAEPGPERLALEQLGDEVGLAVVDAHVVEGHHVRVGHRADQPRFSLEALHEGAVCAQCLRDHLDRDLASESGVPRPVDLGHPARSQECQHLVGPQPDPGRQAHTSRPYTLRGGATGRVSGAPAGTR